MRDTVSSFSGPIFDVVMPCSCGRHSTLGSPSRLAEPLSADFLPGTYYFPYGPASPNVSSINSKYHGWEMTPSNVMFSNGEVDPWRTLGVQADKKVNPNAYVRNSTKEIPVCNQTPETGTVFGQVYPGQVSDYTNFLVLSRRRPRLVKAMLAATKTY